MGKCDTGVMKGVSGSMTLSTTVADGDRYSVTVSMTVADGNRRTIVESAIVVTNIFLVSHDLTGLVRLDRIGGGTYRVEAGERGERDAAASSEDVLTAVTDVARHERARARHHERSRGEPDRVGLHLFGTVDAR